MNNLFNMLNPVHSLIGSISTIIVVVELLTKLIEYLKHKIYIKIVLNFKSKDCFISQTIYSNSNTNAREVITYASMQSFQMINEMLYKVNYKITPYCNNFTGKNIIHIGGSASNIHVNALFVEHKFRFEFWTPKSDKSNHQDLKLSLNCFHYTDDNMRFFKIGNKKLSIEENVRDYAIIIRIPRNYKLGVDYSTHIIFGCWANGTLKAVDFLPKTIK